MRTEFTLSNDKLIVTSFWRPAICKTRRGYSVCAGDGNEYPVSSSFKISDIIWQPIEIKEKVAEIGLWNVKSFTRNETYKVEKLPTRWRCNCVGYMYHKNCSHIDYIKEQKGYVKKRPITEEQRNKIKKLINVLNKKKSKIPNTFFEGKKLLQTLTKEKRAKKRIRKSHRIS